ncbi:MAG TPA: sulfatase, partial [Thermoplasmata archaeon]|nr:sulfatase [Thermoplasmata archaeon]
MPAPSELFSAGLPAGRRPNMLIVVMDCVRASDFVGGAEGVTGLPFLDQLRTESIVFPRAASVAPWTIPAHSTLFTGLYPWQHRAHAKGTVQLDLAIPRLPNLLRPYGYQSICLSANPLLSPAFGLVEGFDASVWAEWWEPYIRMTRRSHPARPFGPQRAEEPSRLQKIHDSPLVTLLHGTADIVYRHPFLVDLANRLLQKVLFPRDESASPVASWIEPTLERWLESVPASAPFFGFINLLEAHEPYLAEPEVIRSLSNYLEYVRTPQDRPSVISGRWSPTAAELELIHRLYRATFRWLDRRLARIVDVLRRTGRWDDTLLILTSDHGQAFGDHGTMFHMHRADEPLVRIPLWVRPPRGVGGGRVAQGWASLVDIPPTLLLEAGGM